MDEEERLTLHTASHQNQFLVCFFNRGLQCLTSIATRWWRPRKWYVFILFLDNDRNIFEVFCQCVMNKLSFFRGTESSRMRWRSSRKLPNKKHKLSSINMFDLELQILTFCINACYIISTCWWMFLKLFFALTREIKCHVF